ncbi:scarecrow-like protein 14, partial [Phalaenopsis equestris]|uniref:scarecrow-like protein 14 n=1 Tax=Phalaenopsis equestris TaxID=78828 RepID=UPI0009E523EF
NQFISPSQSSSSSVNDDELFFKTLPASQFEKGVEEAKKFLPSADKLVINFGEIDHKFHREATNSSRRPKHHHRDESAFGDLRRKKYSAISFEEPAVPPQDLDDILLCGSDFPQVVSAIREKIFNEATNKSTKHRRQNEEVVDLNTLLLHCAQTITAGNNQRANDLLRQIRHHSSPHGDAFQRLAHYIADGLEARLAGTGSEVYRSLVNKRKTVSDVLKAYQLYLATCPFRKLSYSYANMTILDTIQTAKRVHIIDFGIFFGFQWPVFIKMLSLRPGGPPKLRITGIDNPLPGFRPAERIEETGRRLAHYAARFGVSFEYHAIAAKFNEVKLEEIHFREDEMLVVNSLFRLHGLADETVVVDCPRDRVLKAIRELSPAVFINVVVNGSYGAPFFMTRFREVLYHFSAVFDMLDATVPRENEQRYLLERDMYGRFLINAISCEGLERERPETYKQWQMRCLRAGFEQIPLCREFVKMVKSKVRAYYHKDFGIDEDGEWVLQEWKGRILYCLSAWRPSFC